MGVEMQKHLPQAHVPSKRLLFGPLTTAADFLTGTVPSSPHNHIPGPPLVGTLQCSTTCDPAITTYNPSPWEDSTSGMLSKTVPGCTYLKQTGL